MSFDDFKDGAFNVVSAIIAIVMCILLFKIFSNICVKPTEYQMTERYDNENFRVFRHNLISDNSISDYVVTVVVDMKTKVMYMNGIPMVDSEGNILLYEGE